MDDIQLDLGKRRNVVIVCGETGAGKTTAIVEEFILPYSAERGMVTIQDSQNAKLLRQFGEIEMDKIPEQKSGKYRVVTADWRTFIDKCCLNYFEKSPKKGLVYIDDADMMPKAEYPPLTNLLGGVRHKKLDFVASFHHFLRVPPYLSGNAQILVLFKTGESPVEADYKRWKHPERVKEAYERVQGHIDTHYFEIIPLYGISG